MRRTERVLFYCHNAVGLGHIARTSAIANALKALAPETDTLVVTGAVSVELLRKDIEYVKLPSARLVPSGGHFTPQAARLSIPFTELVTWRSALINTTVAQFRPDVMLVDHNPAGFYHELDATIEHCARESTRPRLVLGLRGVAFGSIDGADLFSTYRRYLETVYDYLVVYTDPVVLPLNIPPALVPKTMYSGYVTRVSIPVVRSSRWPAQMIVSAGSGSVGYTLLSTVLDIAPDLLSCGWEILVALGPMMPPEQAKALSARAALLGSGLEVVPFLPNLPDRLVSADLFVGRAGYNTLADVMAARCRALVIPYEVDMGDQLQHARAVECAGQVSVLRERDLTAEALLVAIETAAQGPLPTQQVDTSGAEKSAQFLLSLAEQAARRDR